MTLQADILVRLKATQTGANDFGGPSFTPSMEKLLQLTDGTTANKADILFVDERAVSESSNDDIDLAGVLSDAFGATVAAAELVALFIINAPRSGAANTSDLTIGAAASNPVIGFLGGTTPTIGPIKPGGFVMIGAGDAAGIGAVAAGSADTLRVANGSGATANYQIAIVARSA